MSPKNLLDSKWTAAVPRERDKHFVLVRIIPSESTSSSGASVELQSLISKRRMIVPQSELTDPERWRQGWL